MFPLYLAKIEGYPVGSRRDAIEKYRVILARCVPLMCIAMAVIMTDITEERVFRNMPEW